MVSSFVAVVVLVVLLISFKEAFDVGRATA
jgi:hypothetical protein